MRTFITLLGVLIALQVNGQIHDSIKYENGYLHYHEYGQGEPVVLLSGGPGASYLQLADVAKAVGKNYRAILLEQRGTGRSMPKPFDATTINIETAVADLNRLLDHLKINQAHFLGHSWGAMLAMTYASKNVDRVKSLILISAGPYKIDRFLFDIYSANKNARLSPEERKLKDIVFDKVSKGTATKKDTDDFYKWELIPVIYDRSSVDSLYLQINKGGLNQQTSNLLFQSLLKGQPNFTSNLEKFKKPVNIIVGAQDPGAFMSYETKLFLPHAKLHWLNRVGHFPMFEQPEQFITLLNAVLTDVIKSPADSK